MKSSGLLLVAAILGFLAGATVTASLGRKNQAGRRRPPARGNQPCVGCYTLLSAPEEFPEEGRNPFENITFPLLAESDRLPLRPAIGTSKIRESILSTPESSQPRLSHNDEKEAKKASRSRRRSQQRGGTRPVCRGCYSGLTIVAPPGYEGNQSSVLESHSESAWESSSEEDGPLPAA